MARARMCAAHGVRWRFNRRSAMRRIIASTLAVMVTMCLPAPSHGQAAATPAPSLMDASPRWEVTLEGRVGFPVGYIRVNETVTHGTRLRLSDLGLDVSETDRKSTRLNSSHL